MTELKGLVGQIPLPWHVPMWQRLIKQHANNQLAHAYLFAGASGLGKLAFARQFARFLLCRNPADQAPCGKCRDCSLASGLSDESSHPDIHLVQPEEGSRDIKIDQIRRLSQFLVKSSHSGSGRVAIVNHAHHMNTSAANGLLKSLEEPGSSSYIFLLTESPGMLSATIRSRCQRMQFTVPPFDQASTWLHAHVDPGEDADRLLAAVDNRPLAALELSRTGTLDAEQDYTDKLYALLLDNQSIPSVVSAGLKLGESTAIRCLLKVSTTLTRNLTVASRKKGREQGREQDREPGGEQGEEQLAGSSPAQLAPVMNILLSRTGDDGGHRKSLIAGILSFHQQSLKAYQQVNSAANPNAQLVLESLLYQFHKLPRA